MVETQSKQKPNFVWLKNCFGFMQKRLADESTEVQKFDTRKPMKHEDIFEPKNQFAKRAVG